MLKETHSSKYVSKRWSAGPSPDVAIERDKVVKDPERQAVRWCEPFAGDDELLLEFLWDRLAFEVWRDKYAGEEVPQ